jgi:hypothetical protein
MKIYRMTMDMKFVCVPPDNSADNFDDFTTRVMDALCDLEEADTGISDPDITASLTNLALSVYMSVEADSERDAMRLFTANVRTALHAAGCWTANWPTFRPQDELPAPRQVDLAGA